MRGKRGGKERRSEEDREERRKGKREWEGGEMGEGWRGSEGERE